jgi:uncharacterized protein (TIGR03083 family)
MGQDAAAEPGNGQESAVAEARAETTPARVSNTAVGRPAPANAAAVEASLGGDLPAVTVDAISATARQAIGRFTALLRSGIDPDRQVTPEWTVRDVARHVAGTAPFYVEMVKGQPSPVHQLQGVGDFNAATLKGVDESDLGRLAEVIDGNFDEVIDAATARGRDVMVPWHGGLMLPLSTLIGAGAGEAMLHGWDVARAVGRPWDIPVDETVDVFHALLPLFPGIVDPDAARRFSAVFEIRLRDERAGRWLLAFDDGKLSVRRYSFAGERVDCVISAAPVAYMLSAYGRLSPVRAALTGQVMARGRRPWLGFRLNKMFVAF